MSVLRLTYKNNSDKARIKKSEIRLVLIKLELKKTKKYIYFIILIIFNKYYLFFFVFYNNLLSFNFIIILDYCF